MQKTASVFLVFLVSYFVAFSQDDSLMTDAEGSQGPRRKPNGEWLAGITFGTLSSINPGFSYYDQISPAQSRTYYTFGIGGHIPLTELGKYSTLWLVPALIGSYAPEDDVDISIPLHVTVGYGGLRKKAQAWGIEGGLGLNIVRRFNEEVFTVAPSAMVDITYAPKNVYRLRLMTDLSSTEIKDEGSGLSYNIRSVVVMIVFGI